MTTDARWMKLSPRRCLQCSWLALDVVWFALAAWIASLLLSHPIGPHEAILGLLILAIRIGWFIRLGMYRAVVRFTGLHTLLILCFSTLAGTVGAMLVATLAGMDEPQPIAYHVLDILLAIALCGGSRIAARLIWNTSRQASGQRVLVIGAGALGEMTIRSLQSAGHRVIGLLDDNLRRQRAVIHGRKVLGTIGELPSLLPRLSVDLAVIAIRDLPQSRLKEIFSLCMSCRLGVKVIKGIDQVVTDQTDMHLDDIALEDLLRRPARNLDGLKVRAMLADKVVMITGAGGSIGSEIARQVAEMGPRRVLLLDHSEHHLYQIEMTLRDEEPGIEIVPLLASLTDHGMVKALLDQHRPNIVFHAAAYKHVPMVEANPYLGIANNVGGTRNLIAAADAAGVDRLVLISTDKAVRPTNVMGASKRICELVLQNHPTTHTHLCAVRFGNVLGSSGSVVPRFLSQIADGGPVTVTHPDITRYFMLIPEACELVLQASTMADHGEIFILDMGQPVKIVDLARQLIFMSGNVPDQDVKIEFTGLRPGEKLYEELLIDETDSRTDVDGITVARPTKVAWDWLEHRVDALLAACARRDLEGLARNLRSVVHEWVPSERYRIALQDSEPGITVASPARRQGSGDSRPLTSVKP